MTDQSGSDRRQEVLPLFHGTTGSNSGYQTQVTVGCLSISSRKTITVGGARTGDDARKPTKSGGNPCLKCFSEIGRRSKEDVELGGKRSEEPAEAKQLPSVPQEHSGIRQGFRRDQRIVQRKKGLPILFPASVRSPFHQLLHNFLQLSSLRRRSRQPQPDGERHIHRRKRLQFRTDQIPSTVDLVRSEGNTWIREPRIESLDQSTITRSF